MVEKADRASGRTVVMLVYEWSTRLMGGSIRAISFAHGLADSGWRVHVVTASPKEEWPDSVAGVTVYEIPSPEKRFGGGISADTADSQLDANPTWLRVLSSIKGLLPLERQLAWYPTFWRRVPRLFRDMSVDVVLTVVAPNVMMPLGHHLARVLRAPHVIDLRDDFADRHLVERISGTYQRLLGAYGHHYIRSASAVSVVSPVTRDRLQARGIPVHLVMNGFVEQHFASVPWEAAPVAPEGPLRIVHLGWLGDFRSIEPVTNAIASLPATVRDAIHIEQIGLIDPRQMRFLEEAGCSAVARPQVSHGEALKHMTSADVLLAIPGDRVPAAMTGKLFEYLRARRPVALIAGDGAARHLGQTARVDLLARPEEVSTIAAGIRDMLDRKRAGTLVTSTKEAVVRGLDRREGARKLAGILEGVAR